MHRFLLWTRALALSAALVLLSPQHAAAGIIELHIHPLYLQPLLPLLTKLIRIWIPPSPDPGGGEDFIPSNTATFYMSNIGGYMVPGEPNPDDLMTKTQWGASTAQDSWRVVIHTFGSDFNTVLAAYRGSSLASLVRLAVNDNYAVPGISTVQSLVQFNVAEGQPYRVQIGGRAGAAKTEGDIYATVSVLPPGGGLSVFLATVGGVPRPGQDYVCRLQFSGASCDAAAFVVHNSTNKALTVAPNSSLGGAFVNPAAFTLAPGQAKTATFKFNAAFNKTTLRTVAGYFAFTGRVGPAIASRATYLGLVSVETGAEGQNVLRASVTRQVGTTHINGGVPFDVRLTNTGAQAATGCYVRSDDPSLKTSWQQLAKISPPTATGAPNVPFAIPAGDARWMRVWVASQRARDAATPDFLGAIIIDCANTAKLDFNVSNRFDLTAFGSFVLRNFNVARLAPTNGRLDVPAAGLAKFRTSLTNTGPAVEMRLNGFYSGPFDDPANSQFTVTGVCQANAAGACIGPTEGVLIYNAPKNVKKYFNVFVRAPTVDPGYDPTKRRVFLNTQQEAPDNVNQDYVHTGIASVAVKKQ